MSKVVAYDWFVRVFHWLFAGLFLTSFIIAKTIDNESPAYIWHMISGLLLGTLVLLRVLWMLVGTSTARLSGFALHPGELITYFREILSGGKRRWFGHNPASSYAALAMMAFALGLGITGILMTSSPNKEDFEDIHEIFANGFMLTVVAHIFGVVLHTLRHRDPIGLSMITGVKTLNAETNGTSPQSVPTRGGAGLLLLAAMIGSAYFITSRYDSLTGKLTLPGLVLQLSENDKDAAKENAGDKDDDDED